MLCVGFRTRWMLLYFVLSLFTFSRLVYGDRYAKYSVRANKAIMSHNITSMVVSSEIECATVCLHKVQCNAVSYECEQLKIVGHGICYLKSELVDLETYTIVDHNGMCYASRESLVLLGWDQRSPSSTSITTTPTTTPVTTPITTQSATQIVDIVEGLNNKCTSSSQADVAVVTRDAVYVYDSYNDVTSTPCDTITNIFNVFSGYSLPDVSTWNAMLTYERTNIDLFANGQVWRWQSSGSSLNPVSGYPKTFSDYIKALYSRTPTNVPDSPIWAVHRSKTGGNDLYFKTDTAFNFYSNQFPNENEFQKTTTFQNQNGDSLNPWGDLIDDVVAVGYLDDQGEDFMLITSNLSVFFYDLDLNTNKLDPPVTITYKGVLAT